MSDLTLEQKHEIASQLDETPQPGVLQAGEYGVEIEDIEEAAEECGVYRCALCGWWTEDIADPLDCHETLCIYCAEYEEE